MEKPGRVFSRAQLLDGVWGHDVEVDERTVDVHIGRLRKALSRGREPIRSAPCAAPATLRGTLMFYRRRLRGYPHPEGSNHTLSVRLVVQAAKATRKSAGSTSHIPAHT